MIHFFMINFGFPQQLINNHTLLLEQPKIPSHSFWVLWYNIK